MSRLTDAEVEEIVRRSIAGSTREKVEVLQKLSDEIVVSPENLAKAEAQLVVAVMDLLRFAAEHPGNPELGQHVSSCTTAAMLVGAVAAKLERFPTAV